MLTLSDINEMTNSFDGSMYSDLYKDVYGCRPHNTSFSSIEEFDRDMKALYVEHDLEMAREALEKKEALDDFLQRIEDTKELIVGCDTKRAIEIIAETEGVTKEDLEHYDWGYLEYILNIGYGTIKTILEE